MFDYDICWCADSDRCKRYDCFRHECHLPKDEHLILTVSNLMWTDLCPMKEESEE